MAMLAFSVTSGWAQAVGGAEGAKPVQGDPGISSMVVTEQPQYRVLRDYAEPGATRRMHAHNDATWHVFTLVTGQLRLTVEGEPPVDVAPGQVVTLKGAARHTFTNTGTVTATIVEVFGRVSPPAAAAEAATAPKELAALDALIGRWEGTSEGKPGKGTVKREYTRALQSRVVQCKNETVYPPQEANPKGERHEDFGVFTFDKAAKRIVFRQFHVEGFVNEYAMEPQASGNTLVFTTTAIENIPHGWRARETYVIKSADDVEEIFELAEPGKEFDVYSRTRLKRIR
jgi:mannose-6-phosphate isomerase-like protein (cupin superfamily)